jgi:tagatose 6-phosphate kinase
MMSPAIHAHDLLVVGANPAIDVYYRLERLSVGEVNRVASVHSATGGKANNLARAYRRLGGNPITTGIVAGDSGRHILKGLTEEGIAHDYVCAEGESRQTVTLVEASRTTVLLEPGPPVTDTALDALASKITELSPAVSAVAFAGSLPPGTPREYIARLIGAVRAASEAFVAVDASGEALRLAAIAGADLIKINGCEFERSFQQSARDRSEVERLYVSLAAGGLSTLCLTDGARGAFILSGQDRFTVRTSATKLVSTAGAGDAFLAGFLYARHRGDPCREAARFASAGGVAALQAVEAGYVDPDAVEMALTRTHLFDAEAFFVEPRP